MKKFAVVVFFAVVAGLVSSCGSNNDCPSGINTTNPNCPNYNPYYYSQPNGQYPYGQTPYQSPYPQSYGQPCQVGTPYCVNGYYYPPTNNPGYGQPCQTGTPYCVNGYYNPPTTR